MLVFKENQKTALVGLSSRERQRIFIARTLIKDTPVVLLDEVTANADVENEQQIQTALREFLKGRTVIMIAHKLSIIQSVNQIIVIENGHICQRSCHDELVSKDGLYKNVWIFSIRRINGQYNPILTTYRA